LYFRPVGVIAAEILVSARTPLRLLELVSYLLVLVRDSAAAGRIVFPFPRGDFRAIGVDIVPLVDVDIDVVVTPVAVVPAPDPCRDGNAGAPEVMVDICRSRIGP